MFQNVFFDIKAEEIVTLDSMTRKVLGFNVYICQKLYFETIVNIDEAGLGREFLWISWV